MAVYVDTPAHEFRGQLYCHMIADLPGELHAMAYTIGLKADWLQKPGTPWEHFDLSPGKRAEAVKHGAVEVTAKELARIARAKRQHPVGRAWNSPAREAVDEAVS